MTTKADENVYNQSIPSALHKVRKTYFENPKRGCIKLAQGKYREKYIF